MMRTILVLTLNGNFAHSPFEFEFEFGRPKFTQVTYSRPEGCKVRAAAADLFTLTAQTVKMANFFDHYKVADD